MIISKKRFDEAIKAAQEKAFCEADKLRWQDERIEGLSRQIRELNERLEKVENKGKKKFVCPCFPKY